MKQHETDECEEIPIECKYEKIGCKTVMFDVFSKRFNDIIQTKRVLILTSLGSNTVLNFSVELFSQCVLAEGKHF